MTPATCSPPPPERARVSDRPTDARTGSVPAARRRRRRQLARAARIGDAIYFTRKRLPIVVTSPGGEGGRVLVTKGAVANVAAVCTTFAEGDDEVPLDAAKCAAIDAYVRARGDDGLRCWPSPPAGCRTARTMTGVGKRWFYRRAG